jgi:hypothetical protein
MKKTRRAIPYIHFSAGLLLAAITLTGCASSGNTPTLPDDRTTAANGPMPACKAAIDDVTRYCSGDSASTGKCNDAKERTRELCIN